MSRKDLQKVLNHIRQTSKSPSEKGTRFEKLMLSFFKQDSRYKNQFKNVWPWAQYPNKKNRDLGIDIVAETYHGDMIAIQCKFYEENTTLAKEDINSFFNELGKKKFAEGIIVSTTDNWTENAEKSLLDRTKKCVRIGVTELGQSDVPDWWDLYKNAKASIPDKKRLREHQKKALDHVLKGFEKQDRGKLIMPCGTGKTFTALNIMEELVNPNSKVLVLMPSLSLVSQTHREFLQNSSKEINAFIVCSDKKAGKDSEDIGNMDLALPPTTNYKELAKKINSVPKGDKKITVIFSTYHSIGVVSDAQKKESLGVLDLIICDEAHRTTGIESKSKDSKKSHWIQVHNDKMIKSKKRLYMTATPRVYTESAQKKAESRNYKTFSMNDPSIYGETFYELKFSEAISQGLLSDYKVVVLAVNEDVVSDAMQDAFGENDELQTDDAVKIVGCWNALSKKFLNSNKFSIMGENHNEIKSKKPMQRAVAFSSTIAESKKFKNYFEQIINEINEYEQKENNPILKCDVHHVDGGMNSLIRGKEISWLKGESEEIESNQCRILSNVRCLSEGVDVPALDAVMFLKARKSEIDIVQSVGRVMRKPSDPNQKKEFGYIILPIVIQSDIEAHEALKSNDRYQVIWKVIQALRSHDDRLEMEIDKLPFSRKMPSNIVTAFIGSDDKNEKNAEREMDRQLRFSFMEDWQKAIVAKLVLKCGDREYLDKLALDVTKAFQRISKRMTESLKGKGDAKYKAVLDRFLKALRAILNESITEKRAIEMLAMHSVTRPLFEALFETKDGFTNQNPVSLSMDKALKLFGNQVIAETKELKHSYESIQKRVRDINTLEGRQNLIKELYQIVFKKSFPKLQEQMGIVYTPIEIVDFILKSSNEILKKEFNGKSLSSRNVRILDPFSGTGTFLTRLIENKNLIKDEDLKRKYTTEILASELILLAYYITTINIENSYHFRKKNIIQEGNKFGLSEGYESFKGAVFTDTFQAMEEEQKGKTTLNEFFSENEKQRERLQKEEIRVIVGNPPYSAKQKSENDNNKNLKYKNLDEKIRETYAKDSKAKNKNSLYDPYIRAIKWATDKISTNPNGGIVSFITNGAFLDNNSMDGLRHHLAKDFTGLYIFNLRGDQRTKGEISRKEGGKIFGAGSRCPIAISFLVKNPNKKNFQIYYHDIGDYLSQKDKILKIKNFKNIFGIKKWKKITPDKNNDWLNQRDESYESFISLGSKDNNVEKIFEIYSMGIQTSRDSWVYNFNKDELSENIKKTINFYNKEVERLKKEGVPKGIDNFVNNDDSQISWSSSMKDHLKKRKIYNYEEGCMRYSIYRPFCKKYLYYPKDGTLIHRVGKTYKSYPDSKTKNLAICTSGKGAKVFSVLMTEAIPCLDLIDKCQHFPRHTYEDNQGNMKKKDNISEKALERFKDCYNGSSVNADKVFFYIYGLLHSKEYVKKYNNDLLKELPRIPMVNDFDKFSEIGEKLSNLHVNYESIPEYKELNIEIMGSVDDENIYKVDKMKHPKKNKEKDKSIIHYNEYITISNIPEKAYEYTVNGYSAIRWIMERYRVKKGKDSLIVNDPNRKDNPKYILDLLQKIIHLSVESVDLINRLPEITDWDICSLDIDEAA